MSYIPPAQDQQNFVRSSKFFSFLDIKKYIQEFDSDQ